MPIVDEAGWKRCVENNQDGYGAQIVEVARHLMDMLDDEAFELTTCHKAICQADNMTDDPGITGNMAACVAKIVAGCHSRGEEWRTKWNLENQSTDEGERANKGKGILNPALLVPKDPQPS